VFYRWICFDTYVLGCLSDELTCFSAGHSITSTVDTSPQIGRGNRKAGCRTQPTTEPLSEKKQFHIHFATRKLKKKEIFSISRVELVVKLFFRNNRLFDRIRWEPLGAND
jgi:hypothetical protein